MNIGNEEVILQPFQKIQLKYYQRAIENFNRDVDDDDDKLNLLVTPYFSRALGIAYKTILDLHGTIEALNQFQLRCIEEAQVKKPVTEQELDSIIDNTFMEIDSKETDDEPNIDCNRQESILYETDEVYAQSLSEKKLLALNCLFSQLLSCCVYLKIAEYYSKRKLSLSCLTHVEEEGEVYTYKSSVEVSFSVNDRLSFYDDVGSLTVQESKEAVATIAVDTHLCYELDFNYSSVVDVDMVAYLEKFAVEHSIPLKMGVIEDKYVIKLGTVYVYTCKDTSDRGRDVLAKQVCSALGIWNKFEGVYFKKKEEYRLKKKVPKSIVLTHQIGGKWFASILGCNKKAQGYTYYHALNCLFALCKDSWFVAPKNILNVFTCRSSCRRSVDTYVCHIENIEDYEGDLDRPGVFDKTETVDGIELMFALLNVCYSSQFVLDDEKQIYIGRTLQDIQLRYGIGYLYDMPFYYQRLKDALGLG